ncbi:MAG TPA: hypothetical protein VID27_06285 [Blastocatellia bacterium]|jgi:hypothetical protein
MNEMNQSNQPPSITQPQPDPQQLEILIRQRRDNQNLGLAALGGLIGASIGAAVWAGVTVVTNFQIGWMAVGVGFLTGLIVRKMGQGIDPIYGIIGATFSLLGCLGGNLLAICIVAAKEVGLPVMDVVSSLTPALIVDVFKESFSPIDLLFYGIALYEGYRFSINRITGQELASITK